MKFSKIALLILLLILASGGYFGMHYLQNKAVKDIQNILAQNNITTESISYDLIKDILHLHKVEGRDIFYKDSSINIENITITGINLEAFTNPNITLPDVAKDVFLEKVTSKFTIMGSDTTNSIDTIHITNWKQNIAKIIAAKQQEGISKAFIQSVMDMEIESLTYSNYILKSNSPTLIQEHNTQSMHLTGMNATHITSYTSQGVHIKTIEPKSTITTVASFESFHAENMPTPSATLVHLLLNTNISALHTLTNEQTDNLIREVALILRKSPKQSYTIKDVKTAILQEGEKDLISLQELLIELNYDTAIEGNFSTNVQLKNIHFDYRLLNLPQNYEQILGKIFNSSFITASFGSQIQLASQGASAVKLSLGAHDAANISAEVDFTLNQSSYVAALKDLNNELLLEKALRDIRFTASKIVFEDQNLLHNLLITLSQLQQSTPQEYFAMLKQHVQPQLDAASKVLGAEGAKALDMCLQNPGTLSISSKSEQALAPMAIFLLGISQPEKLNITTHCIPGKSILEAR